jgi:hypothetical protein
VGSGVMNWGQSVGNCKKKKKNNQIDGFMLPVVESVISENIEASSSYLKGFSRLTTGHHLLHHEVR